MGISTKTFPSPLDLSESLHSNKHDVERDKKSMTKKKKQRGCRKQKREKRTIVKGKLKNRLPRKKKKYSEQRTPISTRSDGKKKLRSWERRRKGSKRKEGKNSRASRGFKVKPILSLQNTETESQRCTCNTILVHPISISKNPKPNSQFGGGEGGHAIKLPSETFGNESFSSRTHGSPLDPDLGIP